MLDLTIQKFAEWNGNKIFILREDLLPIACGGNKVRIAIKLLEDARRKGADTIIGYGNSRSNLCRVLSMLCAHEGIKCVIVSPADDDGSRVETTNSLVSKICGAEIVTCAKTSAITDVIQSTIDRLADDGHHPYYINGDKTGHGNEAVLSAAYEEVSHAIKVWERANNIYFDVVSCAVGTGSTFAGLLNGFAGSTGGRHLLGFTIARGVDRCISGIDTFLKSKSLWANARIDDGVLLGGYGKSSIGLNRFLDEVTRKYSILFDSTYAGKALWGLKLWCERAIEKHHCVLFVHTGSLPLAIDNITGVFDESRTTDFSA